MKKFLSLALFTVLLTACNQTETPSDETPTVGTPEEEQEGRVETITLALVAMNDGVTTPPSDSFGCGDTIEFIESEEEPFGNASGDVLTALEELFAIEESLDEESGLYNALAASDITVDSVNSDGMTTFVSLSGSIISAGTCDDPRIEEQIRATVEANSPTNRDISISFDGAPLHEYFDMSGGQE